MADGCTVLLTFDFDAEALWDVVSEEASFVTGVALPVDGGRVA